MRSLWFFVYVQHPQLFQVPLDLLSSFVMRYSDSSSYLPILPFFYFTFSPPLYWRGICGKGGAITSLGVFSLLFPTSGSSKPGDPAVQQRILHPDSAFTQDALPRCWAQPEPLWAPLQSIPHTPSAGQLQHPDPWMPGPGPGQQLPFQGGFLRFPT